MPNKKTLTVIFVLTAMGIFICCGAIVRASVVKDGLVSYWTLDSATIGKGGVVKDIFGNNNGKIIGEPKTVEGVIAQALHFGGADHIEVESNKSLQLTSAFTIDAWVNGDAAPKKAGTVSQWFSKGSNYLLSWDHNADTYQSIASQMTGGWLIIAQIKETLVGKQWYHIAGTWDSRSMKIYLNGKLSKSRTWAGTPTIGEEPLVIGGTGFIGAVDEVKLYNRTLTEEEILRNFQDRFQLSVTSDTCKLPALWGEIKTSK